MGQKVEAQEKLWRKALEREKPRTRVKHIESQGYDSGLRGVAYSWRTRLTHEGKELSYVSMRRPVVKNGKKVAGDIEVNSQLEVVVHKYPAISGGHIWIKDEFLERLQEPKPE